MEQIDAASGRLRAGACWSTRLPNGLALESEGDLWVAESKVPALLKLTMDGELTTISTGSPDLPFLLA